MLSLKKEESKKLQLAPLFGAEQPPPLWHSPPFLAEFADPFLQRSGLDGSLDCSKSFGTLSLALGRVCSTLGEAGAQGADRSDDKHALQASQLSALQHVLATLEASKKLWKTCRLLRTRIDAANATSAFLLPNRRSPRHLSTDPLALR